VTTEADDDEGVILAEIVNEEDQLPAVAESRRPRYRITKHTMLGPGELPPVEGEGPVYTEQDVRIAPRRRSPSTRTC
jgi:hypothetical protein